MPSIAIQVPYQAQPGMKIKAKLADGRSFLVTIPEGAYYPTQLMVSVPDAPVAATGNPIMDSKPIDLPSDSKIEKLEGTAGTTMDEGVDAKDLTAICALCCVSTNLYCTWPGCIGCHQKGDMCCIQIEGVACKVGVTEGSLCMCVKSELECIKPTTCIKMTEQCFCLDCRCAFPCDDEVPCAVTVLGLTCCFNWSPKCECGAKLAEDKEEGGAPAEEVADEEQEMQVMDRQ
eukprot:CAMPEP_0182556542 /NCGR_PEP_ID=MMETSP1324-20130603/769_1 /TAXON_ID=236786 /ORGANISM="Florenciella sp., Strain RCC1587" /LENGTH=230 /DNA_ID=CAMNT_0024768447 /DNA_START=82 /DNA_END=774 /DNA_ORIENTATION=+